MIQALKSRTILFGLLLALASAIQAFVPFLPPQYIDLVGAGVSAAIIVLRFLTTVPVAEK